MRKLLIGLVAAFGLAAVAGPAAAFGPGDCTGTVNMQVGSVIQWKNSTGVIHPGLLLSFDGAHLKWNIITYGSTGTVSVVTDATYDQSQTANSSFAVISCATPF